MKKITITAGWFPSSMSDIVRYAAPGLEIESIGTESSGTEVSCILLADRDLTAEERESIRQGFLSATPQFSTQEFI